MCSGLNNFAFIEHHNGVKVEKGKYAVSDNDGGLMLQVYT
jgi:hypothetical protein